ncbi:MAG: DUF296 domain-containing protein [Thaumarchaeota archaeon]|nr:DUF296 domain-containing protein [Nitrososphaerota archaeon]
MAKIHSLKAGSKIPDDIVALAAREKVRTAQVEAIGGVKALRLAYFNHEAKKYEEHDFDEFLEVTSLLGNITVKDGKPFLHVHGTFARRDLSVVAGHVMSGTVFPLLELVVTPTRNRALRRFDEEVGLNVIYKA